MKILEPKNTVAKIKNLTDLQADQAEKISEINRYNFHIHIEDTFIIFEQKNKIRKLVKI